MCLYPRLIINKKYTSTQKNGGKPPVLTDNRIKYVPIGCGNCLECRKQIARGWQLRLQEDIKKNINAKMITLTFSDESITDIKTDKWEIAIDAMDKVSKSAVARRNMAIGERTYDTMTPEQQKTFNEKYPKNKHNKQTNEGKA